jgi:hypothetical protein
MITPLLLSSLLSQPAVAFVSPQTCIGLRSPSLPTLVRSQRGDRRVRVVAGLALSDDWAELTSRITSASIKAQAPIPEEAVSSQPLSDLLEWQKWINFLSLDNAQQTIASSSSSTLETSVAFFVALPVLVKLGIAMIPLTLTLLAGVYNMALMAPKDFRQGMDPYPRGKYDPIQAKAYYSRHSRLVLQRASQVFRLTSYSLTSTF